MSSKKNFKMSSPRPRVGEQKKKPKKKGKKPKASYVLLSSPLHSFVLKNCKSGFVDVKSKTLALSKSNRVSDQVYEPANTDVASPFVSLNTPYRFRLGGHATISLTLGVANGFFACDPSASGVNFPEWPTLSALFSEFRLVSFHAQFVTAHFASQTLGATTGTNPFAICGNLGTAASPGSYAAVCDNADAKLWSFGQDTTREGYTHMINGRGVGWSQVTTPTTEPFAGAPGSIQYFHEYGSLLTAPQLVHVLVWGIYEFRSRV